jgi:hypothetical protein
MQIGALKSGEKIMSNSSSKGTALREALLRKMRRLIEEADRLVAESSS